jgi:hypothetical protein
MGGMARRGAMRAVRRIMGAVGSRAASPVLGERSRDRSSSSDTPAVQRATSVRVYRQAPAPGSGSGGYGGHEVAPRPERRSLEVGAAPGGSAGATRRTGVLERVRSAQGGAERSTPGALLGRGVSPSGSSDVRRTLSVNAAGVASPVSVSKAGAASKERSKARHSKRISIEASASRYEPRTHTHSASLRDGPPKAPRERRRSSSARQRRFRDYSSVTKDGVTVLVPGRSRR